MMDRLRFLEDQCIPLENCIKENAKEKDDAKLLMSVPGVDYYLASLLLHQGCEPIPIRQSSSKLRLCENSAWEPVGL